MSIYSQIDNNEELKEVTEAENGYFQYEKSEGAPYLFYNHEEFEDLMGHEIHFYPTGVLLSLKDDVKDYDESRSYVFFNNSGKKILKIHNRRPVLDENTKHYTYLRPNVDIQVKVFKDYIYVLKTNSETHEQTESYIDVLTGEIQTNIIDGEQLSMDI